MLGAIRHAVLIGSVQWLMVVSYAWVWMRSRMGWPFGEEKLSRIHRGHARRFKRVASTLKGSNIKVGQLVSLQPHLVPPEYIEEFRSMRDEVTPTPWPEVAAVLAEQLGPLDTHFATIEHEPIASASMAQVHAATLPSGERVAVKVLHPGLERSVAVDMWLLRRLVSFFQLFMARFDLWQIYKEIDRPLRKELDLEAEGRATELLGGEIADLGVIVPTIHWPLTTRRVLTMSFIDGVPLSDRAQMDAWGVDRRALMVVYLRAFFRQAFEGGHFHCDPHPANAFCTPTGALALIDFGMVKQIPEQVRNGLVKEMLGAFLNHPEMYADGIIDRGVVDRRERDRLIEFARETFADEAMRATIFDHDPQS
ncbi:MAG: putative unusual protein kinase regulating ubiquinone biosynthesis (AarF/ABC1/UbiB family), partial [Myxococcota bacterium]